MSMESFIERSENIKSNIALIKQGCKKIKYLNSSGKRPAELDKAVKLTRGTIMTSRTLLRTLRDEAEQLPVAPGSSAHPMELREIGIKVCHTLMTQIIEGLKSERCPPYTDEFISLVGELILELFPNEVEGTFLELSRVIVMQNELLSYIGLQLQEVKNLESDIDAITPTDAVDRKDTSEAAEESTIHLDIVDHIHCSIIGNYQSLLKQRLSLENAITELHRMFLDLSVLTAKQSELQDLIESLLQEASNRIFECNSEMSEALFSGASAVFAGSDEEWSNLEAECSSFDEQFARASQCAEVVEQKLALLAKLESNKGDVSLCAKIAEELDTLERGSVAMPVTVMQYLALPDWHATLVEKVECACKVLVEQDQPERLLILAPKLASLQALDISRFCVPSASIEWCFSKPANPTQSIELQKILEICANIHKQAFHAPAWKHFVLREANLTERWDAAHASTPINYVLVGQLMIERRALKQEAEQSPLSFEDYDSLPERIESAMEQLQEACEEAIETRQFGALKVAATELIALKALDISQEVQPCDSDPVYVENSVFADLNNAAETANVLGDLPVHNDPVSVESKEKPCNQASQDPELD